MSKKLIIVDISSFIFRAFYAIRPLTSPQGKPVNAVFGVFTMLLKLMNQQKPTHLFLARDSKDDSFRKKIYPEYKANRQETPEDLIPQFKMIEEMIEKMQLPSDIEPHYEADDIIGSAITKWKKHFDEIYVATGDKDLMQFVGDNVFLLDTKLDKIYGRNEVKEKMGVWPEQIVDYLAIVGDASDNIPGMRGIGAKGAAKLLEEYGSFEQCIKNKDQLKNKKMVTAFSEYLENGRLSKKLVQIDTKLKLSLTPEKTKYHFTPTKDLETFLLDMGFKSQVNKLSSFKGNNENTKTDSSTSKSNKISISSYKIITNEKDFKSLGTELKNIKRLALHTEYCAEKTHEEEIQSLSLCLDSKKSYYIPFIHNKQTLDKKFLTDIFSLINHQKITLIGHDLKKLFFHMFALKIFPQMNFFDNSQAHYLIDVSKVHDLPTLSAKYLDVNLPEKAKGDLPLWEDELKESALYGVQRSKTNDLIYSILQKEIKSLNLEKIFYDIDLPLIPILANMESQGILLNKASIKNLEKIFSKELSSIETKIEAITKESINLKSSKQVSELLFQKLQLPEIKKGKTMSSTDASVLEELDSRGLSDVPGLILKYRELDKLLSTYIRPLPELSHPQTGRIHAKFHQNVTATGRLSSEHPNLQNIPTRTPNGKKIRKGLIASPGNLLISADYSQIELRLLAHFSSDPTMLQAFSHDVDIHKQTASEILGISPEKVNSQQRNQAKTVNFGLMYGQSSFGLAKQLRITRREAKEYIDHYFHKFGSIKAFLDSLKEKCAQTGYTETLLGRKRPLPDIHSQNRTIKAMAERMAINTPIQGTAADIIKIAMINICKTIRQEKIQSRMILQIHDELIFEVPEKEVSLMILLIKEKMENAVKLKVPLKIDMGMGVNLFDLK